MSKLDVAGLKIDALTKAELLRQITERVQRKEKTFVATPYSEFLYAAVRDREVKMLLNKADFSIADGVGILWAHLFLSQPLTWPGFYLKIAQAWLQMVWTGASILLYPKLIYRDIPEKIVGANLIWDLAALAEKNNFSVFLLGGFNDTTEKAANKLREKFPNLRIVGYSNKNPNNPSVVEEINSAKPDLLFVAYGPLTQEKWIDENLQQLETSFAIGLGGTFDYVAGTKKQPPHFIRNSGLEWLYRLITQPSRVVRIYRAFWGLIVAMVRYKIFSLTPYRLTGLAVVIDKNKNVLLCKKGATLARKFHPLAKEDYWHFPQGGVDEGEDLVKGTTRELTEETGITSVKPLGIAKFEYKYVWNLAAKPILKSNHYNKGSELKTVFFLFTGEHEEVAIDGYEMTDHQWVPIDKVLDVIAPERREHATAVLAELKAYSV